VASRLHAARPEQASKDPRARRRTLPYCSDRTRPPSAAPAGADVVVIDQEHGPIGAESVHAMVAATAGTQCSPWVRVPSVDEPATKSALDAGAEGILFPLIRTAQSAAECVALTRYPPEGRRGFGPFVGHSRWGVDLFDYLPKRGGETVCAILIETRSAIEHLEEICRSRASTA
jgi:4-hydroxy-2-oxoheptanedioate aldolase